MDVINVGDAKMNLSRVEAGEEVVIGRAGRPVAKLVPFRPSLRRRKFGGWRGKVWISDDFKALPEDIAAAFRGEGNYN
jgi:antitoxin (DNA-binding transcriptional repressor) of toxin-antitoxin stability system